MKSKLTALLIFFISCNPYLFAQSTLPIEVQADLKQEEIISALKQKDFSRANDLFAAYDEIGVDMPSPLILMRAQVSFQLQKYLPAKQHLEQYLANSERGSDSYKKALKMYSEISSLALPEEKKIEQQKEAKEERIRVAKDEADRVRREAEDLSRRIRNSIIGEWEYTDTGLGQVVKKYTSDGEWMLRKKNKKKILYAGDWAVAIGHETARHSDSPNAVYYFERDYESIKKKKIFRHQEGNITRKYGSEIRMRSNGQLYDPDRSFTYFQKRLN